MNLDISRAIRPFLDVSRTLLQIYGVHYPPQKRRNMRPSQRSGLKTLHLRRFSPSKQTLIWSHMSSLMQCIEWHLPYASALSRTFKRSCSRLVEFVPLFSQHMKVKMVNSRSLCKSDMATPSTCSSLIMMLLNSSDDGHNALGNVKNFFDYCPDYHSAALWDEWVQFGMKCFANGESLINLH